MNDTETTTEPQPQASPPALQSSIPSAQPEPTNAPGIAALLDSISATLSRFVILPDHAADTLALWALHTYAYPRLTAAIRK